VFGEGCARAGILRTTHWLGAFDLVSDVTGQSGYTPDHSIGYYAIDGQGQARVLFRQEHPVADLVQHLRLLLDE